MNFFSIGMSGFIRCTPGAVLMAVLSSNLFLAVISFFLRFVHTVKDSKFRILYIFPAVILVRCLLPFEFFFSKTIVFPDRISGFFQIFLKPLFQIGDVSINGSMLILAVWFLGSVIKGVKIFRSAYIGIKYVKRYTSDVTDEEPYKSLMDRICGEWERPNRFRVYKVDALSFPALQGIFKPYLLLPAELKLIEKDLYYILKYHAAHYFQYSLWIKFFMNLMEILFWWNPILYIIRRQVWFLLDIQADENVAKGEKKTVCNYIDSRMRVLRFASKDDHAAGMLKTYVKELESRFLLMLRKSEEKKFFPGYLVLAVLGIVIMILSYRFIPLTNLTSEQVATVQEDEQEVDAEEDFGISDNNME